jgi:hypothetical protein
MLDENRIVRSSELLPAACQSQSLFAPETDPIPTSANLVPILSYGMGVESTAILLRYLEEPDTFEDDLSELIVIVAMTGDEWEDTRTDVERHILPRVREHNVRFVQVARAGASQKDGIIVLDDSRQPRKLFVEGAYKLSDELQSAGMVPAFAGQHKCSLKYKAFVIESWLQQNVYPDGIRHTFGYNVDELGRVAKSDQAIARIIFGFNSNESARVLKGLAYDRPYRIGHYPLVLWGWDRLDCFLYIKDATGVDWRKSACVYCPFAKVDAGMIARQQQFPAQVAQAMILERLSLAMNPRGQLYNKQPLYQIVTANGNQAALELFQSRFQDQTWALYRVRRIYQPKAIYEGTKKQRRLVGHDANKKGIAQRCVERIAEFATSGHAVQHLQKIAEQDRLPVCVQHDLSYAIVSECATTYPTTEEYYVAAPALVQTKARNGVADFNNDWMALGDLYCGLDDIPDLFANV